MARTSPRWCRALVLALGSAVALSACGDGDGEGERACGPITREALDPAFLVHVLDDGAGVEYTSDPPTSGPHRAGPGIEGVVSDPIPRPVQVGILEAGSILIQHDPELDDAARTELEALAGPEVVVAPNADLPHPVVATAWLYKRTCEAVDADALQRFIEDRVGTGPGADPSG